MENTSSRDGYTRKKRSTRMLTGIGKKDRAPGEVKQYTPEEIEAFLKERGGKLLDPDAEA